MSALLGAASLCCTGCATVITGTVQEVTINSTPPGAHVNVGPHFGVTPERFVFLRGEDYTIEARYGDQVRTMSLNRKFDKVGILNILFPPGFLVDAVSGAITRYEPDAYMIEFDVATAERQRRQGKAP